MKKENQNNRDCQIYVIERASWNQGQVLMSDHLPI